MPTAAASGKIAELKAALHTTDRLLISFWGLLAIVSLVLHARIPSWRLILLADLSAVLLVCAVAYAAHRTGLRALRWAHDWAAYPLVVFTYKQLYLIIGPIHNHRDYDQLLITVDYGLFRLNPTEWMAKFSNPLLTETLQIAYSLFYAIFLAAGFEIYRRLDLPHFRYFSFTIVYGFLISYIGYFFLPAAGPRFMLHDFSQINSELPGLWLTPALRQFVNFFESIPSGASNAAALAAAQRDVFPSGHAMMTLVAVVLAHRYRLRIRAWVYVVGALLMMATVYLRYHYLIDIFAGALLALPCLLTSNRMFRYFDNDRQAFSR